MASAAESKTPDDSPAKTPRRKATSPTKPHARRPTQSKSGKGGRGSKQATEVIAEPSVPPTAREGPDREPGTEPDSLEQRMLRIERLLERLTARPATRDAHRPELGRLDYFVADIYLRLSSPNEVEQLAFCKRKPWLVEWIEQDIRPGEAVYDIGANVGACALVAAKALDGEAPVVAIEPGYANFEGLCENIRLNHATAAITPLQIALGERTGVEPLVYSDATPGAGGHILGEPGSPHPAVHVQPTLTFRLEQLVKIFDLPAPVHLRVDVAGTETAVLRGAANVLESDALRSVMVDTAGEATEDVFNLLTRTHDLRLRERFQRSKDGRAAEANTSALFVRD